MQLVGIHARSRATVVISLFVCFLIFQAVQQNALGGISRRRAESSNDGAHQQLRQLLLSVPPLPISTGDPLNSYFIASDTHRFVYLRHVGKVAGTTVEVGYFLQAFCKMYYKNATTKTETIFGGNVVPAGCFKFLRANKILYEPEYGVTWKQYESYYTFAFLRNPYARVVSSYFYLKPSMMNGKGNASAEYTFLDFLSDPDRMARYLRLTRGHHSRHWGSQVSGLLGSGVRRIDYLGCVENLAANLQHVVDQINGRLDASKPRLPPVNYMKQNARNKTDTFQSLTSCSGSTTSCGNYAESDCFHKLHVMYRVDAALICCN